MYRDYRALKAAGLAQVTSVNSETVCQRQYYDRQGSPEAPVNEVLTIGYIAQELNLLLEMIEDIKALGADFAETEGITIAQLRAAVATATQGL